MSIDFFIYGTRDTPITFLALYDVLRNAGWTPLVMQGSKEVEAGDEPLRKGVLYEIHGMKNGALLNAVRAALQKSKSLTKLYETGRLNSIYLSVDELAEPLDPKEFGKAGAAHPDVLKSVRLRYGINGHGGDLQLNLWDHLGAALDGFKGDPQSDDYVRCGPGARGKGRSSKRARK